MAVVNESPMGLVGLVGLQNLGELPRDLGAVVSPVVGFSELYKLAKLTTHFGLWTPAPGTRQQDAVTPLPQELAFTVPIGEVWWFDNATLSLNPGAGVTFRAQLAVQDNPSISVAVSPRSSIVTTPDSEWVFGRDFWMKAGQRLVVRYDQVAGVPAAGSGLVTARLARFKA